MQNTGASAAAEVEDLALPIGAGEGRVLVRIFRASGVEHPLPVVLCLLRRSSYGDQYDHLPRALAVGIPAAVLVADQPDVLEVLHGVLQWIAGDGVRRRLDGGRIALAGDDLSRNLVTSLESLTASRGGPKLRGVFTIAAGDGAFTEALTALAQSLI